MGTSEDTVTPHLPTSQPFGKDQNEEHIILFYKYTSLSGDETILKLYQDALQELCSALSLSGRILLGLSSMSEGINGTLASFRKSHLEAFTEAISMGSTSCEMDREDQFSEDKVQRAVEKFRNAAKAFAVAAKVQVPTVEEFKWSKTTSPSSEKPPMESVFPDLQIKMVPEIISTGGKLSHIRETGVGYLTPKQWHEEMLHLSSSKDTILIDCRNRKEYDIGHFPSALDPQTRTFAEFPSWVDRVQDSLLADKRVLMYCTGGIRCEKASAYIRQTTRAKEVLHLQGGIHKYLDQYSSSGEGTFCGKNFVFDRRIAMDEASSETGGPVQSLSGAVDTGGKPDSKKVAGCEEQATAKNPHRKETLCVNNPSQDPSPDTKRNAAAMKSKTIIVGKCLCCSAPYDSYSPSVVCTVCRDPVLVCSDCQENLLEYHCVDHFMWRSFYFTFLEPFTNDQLAQQLTQLKQYLEEIAIGKKYRQKRKTVNRQMTKIEAELEKRRTRATGNSSSTEEMDTQPTTPVKRKCRHCNDATCRGDCWGFHGLQRKEKLEQLQSTGNATRSAGVEKIQEDASSAMDDRVNEETAPPTKKKQRLRSQAGRQRKPRQRVAANRRSSKLEQRRRQEEELHRLGFPSRMLPSFGWDTTTGIRCAAPCIRVLRAAVKKKWCGKSIRHVLQSEFLDNGWGSDVSTSGSKSQEIPDKGQVEHVLEHGLIRCNGKLVVAMDGENYSNRPGAAASKSSGMVVSAEELLKNMDTISRVVHWHEAPILLPSSILTVSKIRLPQDEFAPLLQEPEGVPPETEKLMEDGTTTQRNGKAVEEGDADEMEEGVRTTGEEDLEEGEERTIGKGGDVGRLPTKKDPDTKDHKADIRIKQEADVDEIVKDGGELPETKLCTDACTVKKKIKVKELSEDENYGRDCIMELEEEGEKEEDWIVYCCDKPCTVPVHPCGPYIANSLTLMVEAQEGLPPRSLLPCHRIDRCTSGLSLCCTSAKLAHLIQEQMTNHQVAKLYVARVQGLFPKNKEESRLILPCTTPDSDPQEELPTPSAPARWNWCTVLNCVQVDGRIDTVDVPNGVRAICATGKPAQTWFQFIDYEESTNLSLIACSPVTGRSHQIRVHLQWLGFPIHRDVLYGGGQHENACRDGTKRLDRAADSVPYDGSQQDKAPCDGAQPDRAWCEGALSSSLSPPSSSPFLSVVAQAFQKHVGRQICVPLQWLGFSSHRDALDDGGGQPKKASSRDGGQPKKESWEEGASCSSLSSSPPLFSVVRALQKQQQDSDETVMSLGDGMDEADAKRAIEACPCRHAGGVGISSLFSKAQLLQGGHAIDLHAWKYRIAFATKKKKKKKGKKKKNIYAKENGEKAQDAAEEAVDCDRNTILSEEPSSVEDGVGRIVKEFSTEALPSWAASTALTSQESGGHLDRMLSLMLKKQMTG